MYSKKGIIKLKSDNETDFNCTMVETPEDLGYDYSFKIILIGSSGVGKSCLLERATKDHFQDDHTVTIGVEFATLYFQIGKHIINLQIWDTAGQEAFRSVTKIFYKGSKAVIIVYDLARMDSFSIVSDWLTEARGLCDSYPLYFLVANMLDKQHFRQVDGESALEMMEHEGFEGFFETSAKTGENVIELFCDIAKLLYSRAIPKSLANKLKIGGNSLKQKKPKRRKQKCKC